MKLRSVLSSYLPILASIVAIFAYVYLKAYVKTDYKSNPSEYGGYSYFIVICVIIFIWQALNR